MKILILSSSNPTKASGIVGVDLFKLLSQDKSNEVKLLVRPWGIYNDGIISLESKLESNFNKGLRYLKRKFS